MTESILVLVQNKWLKRSVLLLCLCLFIGGLLANESLLVIFNADWIDLNIRNQGLTGVLQFMAFGAVTTAFGMPRQIVAFLGGYAFGFVMGTLLATLAAGIGCMLSLYFARLVIRDYVKHKFPQKISNINRFLCSKPITKTIVIRLLPIGNNLITNLAAGMTSVSGYRFLLGSLLGYLPQMAIFALMGKGVIVMSVWKIGLSIVLFGVSSLLSIRLYKQYKATALLDIELSSSHNHADDKQAI